MATKAPGLNRKKSSGIFKEGPGDHKCVSCGASRNKYYPMGHKKYCTKCFKAGKYE